MNRFYDRSVLVFQLVLTVIFANLAFWRIDNWSSGKAALNAACMVFFAIQFVVKLTNKDGKQ